MREQREIKFRAWDKNRKRMMPVVEIQWRVHQVNIEEIQGIELEPDKHTVFLTSHIDGYELMQFTGLKDKNGIEIYEGDIVNVEMYQGAGMRPKYKPEPFKVEWSNNDARFKLKDDLDSNWEFDTSNEMEVIGNIYEPPALLTP